MLSFLLASAFAQDTVLIQAHGTLEAMEGTTRVSLEDAAVPARIVGREMGHLLVQVGVGGLDCDQSFIPAQIELLARVSSLDLVKVLTEAHSWEDPSGAEVHVGPGTPVVRDGGRWVVDPREAFGLRLPVEESWVGTVFQAQEPAPFVLVDPPLWRVLGVKNALVGATPWGSVQARKWDKKPTLRVVEGDRVTDTLCHATVAFHPDNVKAESSTVGVIGGVLGQQDSEEDLWVRAHATLSWEDGSKAGTVLEAHRLTFPHPVDDRICFHPSVWLKFQLCADYTEVMPKVVGSP